VDGAVQRSGRGSAKGFVGLRLGIRAFFFSVTDGDAPIYIFIASVFYWVYMFIYISSSSFFY
jgi:hypothetical protein